MSNDHTHKVSLVEQNRVSPESRKSHSNKSTPWGIKRKRKANYHKDIFSEWLASNSQMSNLKRKELNSMTDISSIPIHPETLLKLWLDPMNIEMWQLSTLSQKESTGSIICKLAFMNITLELMRGYNCLGGAFLSKIGSWYLFIKWYLCIKFYRSYEEDKFMVHNVVSVQKLLSDLNVKQK